MIFKSSLYDLFPSCSDKEVAFSTDWEALEKALPKFKSISSEPEDCRCMIKPLEEDYAVWAASRAEDVVAIDVKRAHRYIRMPPKKRWPDETWIRYPASVLNNFEDRRAQIRVGFCDELTSGPATTVSETWAVVFSQIPQTLLYDLGNIFADISEAQPDSMTARELNRMSDAEKLWDNKVSLLTAASFILDKDNSTWLTSGLSTDEVLAVLKADNTEINELFSGTSLGRLFYGDKLPVKIMRTIHTLVVDLYSWCITSTVSERTFHLERKGSVNRVCHSLHTASSFWLQQNDIIQGELPNYPTWQEYINVLALVQNAVMQNLQGRTADNVMDAFRHIVLCHSTPNEALWKWLQERSPIYRMLAFS